MPSHYRDYAQANSKRCDRHYITRGYKTFTAYKFYIKQSELSAVHKNEIHNLHSTLSVLNRLIHKRPSLTFL